MKLDRIPDEEKTKICRKYFIAGFFLLPFVWLINLIWFSREALKKNGSADIRRYVAGSFLGFVVWVAVLAVWISVYQTQRPNWGAAGDYISFSVPVGRL